MNKGLKKILGLAIAINIISGVVPTTLSIGAQEVQAATRSGYLEGIEVETNKDKNVTLYTKSNCKSDYKLSKLDDDDKIPTSLYGEVSDSVKKLKITKVDLTDDSKYSYKIYKGNDEIDLDEEVKASSNTTLKVKVFEGDTLKETYSIKIEKDDDDDDDDDMDDNIYLDDITLTYNYDTVKLGFKQKTTEYNIEVENKVNFLRIAAEPEDDDDRVKVNGVRVKDEDDWETKVSLKEGKNKIEIEVSDEDQENERTYVINVTRLSTNGTSSNNTTSNTTGTSSNTGSAKNTGWKYTNGKWQYYDVNGNQYKNSWVTDAKGKSYYLGADGNMVTGWANVGGNQYYFDLVSGERKTGWICLGKTWYQLDSRGALVK